MEPVNNKNNYFGGRKRCEQWPFLLTPLSNNLSLSLSLSLLSLLRQGLENIKNKYLYQDWIAKKIRD